MASCNTLKSDRISKGNTMVNRMWDWLKEFISPHAEYTMLKEILFLLFIIIFSYLATLIIRYYGFLAIRKVAKIHLKKGVSSYLFLKTLFKRGPMLVVGVLIYISLYYGQMYFFDKVIYFNAILIKLTQVYVVIAASILIVTWMNLIEKIYIQKVDRKLSYLPVASVIDSIKFCMCIFVGLIAFAILTDLSMTKIITGLSALGALTAFVFQDAIRGFFICLQISWYDSCRIGDWITIPGTSADGTLKRLSFSLMQIQNFDTSMITIPTHTILVKGIINMSDMLRLGKRRMCKSIAINSQTISIMNITTFNSIMQYQQISDMLGDYTYTENLTNMGLFRIYTMAYLKQHRQISKTNTRMTRITHHTSQGLIFEIYAFVNTPDFVAFENLQSGIIEHFVAILPQFDLKTSCVYMQID